MEAISKDSRQGIPDHDLSMKNMSITDDTDVVDMFWKMMPLDRDALLKLVRDRAEDIDDKKYRNWNVHHVDEAIKVIIGGAQFTTHTDLWATEYKGIMPPPDFGRYLTKDRFTRVLRYWARGTLGVEHDLGHDPWGEVRPWIEGHNNKRLKELSPGTRLVADESMLPWHGNAGSGGVPHLSFIKRKPHPLGVEVKTVCDCSTGVMMYCDLQEGKIRMQRKHYADKFPHTTACTARLFFKMGMNETGIRNRIHRIVYADSWFAGRTTARALMAELGLHFTGPVKTSTRGFPMDALRWAVSEEERGGHVVFHNEEEDLWAVGWNDHHYKCYITTQGTTEPGKDAQKKRQRLNDGHNYNVAVKRPDVIARYQSDMGFVDRHNRFRHEMLGLHEIWKTKRWQTRIQIEMIAIAVIDTFLLARKFMPRYHDDANDETSAFWKFTRDLIVQLTRDRPPEDETSSRCFQVATGKYVVQDGPNKGKKFSKQYCCHYCSLSRRKEIKTDGTAGTKAPRTSYSCIAHPKIYMCRKGKCTCWEEHLADITLGKGGNTDSLDF